MTRCPVCLTENEEHFQFCLACGAELKAPAKPAGKKTSPNAVSRAPSSAPLPAATPPKREVVSALKAEVPLTPTTPDMQAQTTVEMEPIAEPAPEVEPPLGDPDQPPIEVGDTEEPITSSAAHDAAPQFDDDDDDEDEDIDQIEHTYLGPKPATVAQQICGSCGAIVPPGHKFCGACGAPYSVSASQPGREPAKMAAAEPEGKILAKLTMILPDGSLGDSYPITEPKLTVGRDATHPLFQEDAFLSPEHAEFEYVEGDLFVSDLGSVNGTYCRLADEIELHHGDKFRLGQELLLLETIDQLPQLLPPSEDGTQVIGSPLAPSVWGRLSQVVALDYFSNAYLLELNEVVLGREAGNVIFPEDGFVSGRHAKLSNRGNRYFLQDLDSSNGTYFQISGKTQLHTGDILLLGQQLFHVDIL